MVPIPKAYGLTGGIASGKSTVSKFFRDLGVPVMEADQISREICKKGQAGWQRIKETFGEGYFKPDGELDRKKLSDCIFSDGRKRKLLENLIHPLIMESARQSIQKHFDDGDPLVLFEAALLMETGHDKEFHGTIVVSCNQKQQIERLCQREGIPEEEALKKMNAQWPLEKKVKKATFVIDNSRDFEDTCRQVKEIFEKIKAKKERRNPLWH